MLTTKGRDFLRHALKPTTPHDRDIFLHTVANKLSCATKMRATDLNIFNFLDDRRSTYIRTGTEDVFLTTAIVSWLSSRGVERFTAEQAALISAQLQGRSVMLCGTPGTGKTFATVLAACHHFMHSSVTMRCHTLIITANRRAARQTARLMRSVAGSSLQNFYVVVDSDAFEKDAQHLAETHPHVLIGTVEELTQVVINSKSIFGTKLRKLVDTLIVDDADAVIAQQGGQELIARLYRRMRDELPSQLIFLSATMDVDTQRQFNALTHSEENVFRLCDSHFEYALPENASFYLYCDKKLRQEQVLLRLLQNIQWMKGGEFRPLLVAEDATQSAVLHKALEVNGLAIESDSAEVRLLGENVSQNAIADVSEIIRAECANGLVLSTDAVRITDQHSLRGVDYPNISDVVLFGEVPTSQRFVNAAGRTARFGASGDVNMIFSPYQSKAMQQLCEVHDMPFKVSAFE